MKYLNSSKKNNWVLITFLFITYAGIGQTYLENFYNIGEEWATIGKHSYFFANSSKGENGLWKTDGTQKGTQLVKEIATQTYDARNMFVYNNELYFAAYEQEVGMELWKSDGTTSGTFVLKNLNPSNSGGSWPSDFTIYKDELYFTAINYYTSGGTRKLFKTNGTAEGTILANNIFDAESNDGVANLKVANGKLYFTRVGILYETDGTLVGTNSVVIDGLQYISDLHSFSDGLYFITYNHRKTVLRLYVLTDTDNYTMIKELMSESNDGFELYNMREINSKVVFSVVSGETYRNVKDALWVTDGTPENTIEIMSQGNSNLWFQPNFHGFVDYNGSLYFDAGPASNSALWKTDGTQQGTVEVIAEAGLSEDAPMIVLNEKLYFLAYLGLSSYDSTTGETVSLSSLRSTRKSTGDNYFVKSDGKYVYTAVRNDREDDSYTMDFFHSGPNPLIEVNAAWAIKNNETLSYNTKVDSLVKSKVNIRNVGNASLAFSKIFVSGEGFYINGDVDVNYYKQENQTYFSQQIEPSESGQLEVGFLPQSPGQYSGYLIIRSNNTAQSEFRIKLEGYASDIAPVSINATFPTEKEIKWDNANTQITLDNTSISENADSGTVVGTFTTNAEGGNFSYQMVEGSGNDDNSVFIINGNQLLTTSGFQVDFKKSYTIRVKSTNEDGTEIEESFVIGIDEESVDVALGACEQVAVSLTSDLYSVDFINDTDAIAVGLGGIVLKTRDKGANWEQLHVIERTSDYHLLASLYDVNFVNESTGFVSGEGTLLRTDDAGDSWHPLQMNELPVFGAVKIIPLNSEVLLIVIDNLLYKSVDGGQSWFLLSSIRVHDNKALYFYNDTLGFASDSWESYSITNDGGITWISYELEIDGLSYDEDISAFSFINSNFGFASTNKGKVLKTEDGGLSWVIINSDYRSQVNEIHFFDENRGYMAAGSLYETIDGGVTWNTVNLSNCVNIRSFSFNGLGDAIGVGYGCYGGNGRTIYTSSLDGNWTEVSAIYGTRDVPSILFDDKEAYLFSTSQSRKSNDGGVTWKNLITPLEDGVAHSEKFGNDILIKDWQGPFYKSSDGGLNWTALGNSESFNKFTILDENTIFAFSSLDAKIYKTGDSGASWDPLPETPVNQNNVIEFLDDNIGYVGGFPGISRTFDGGISWEELIIEPGQSISIYGIEFANQQVAMISTTNGYYKTMDGGDSWVKLFLNIGHTNTILALNELEWYIKGSRYIYTSNDGGETWVKFFDSGNDILDLDRVEDTFYYSDGDGGVYKLINDPEPLSAGYIKGDRNVRVGDEEIYEVVKHSDNEYVWTITGANELTSEDSFSRIKWETPGTYTLQVTPYASCSTGVPSEITVQVYGQMTPPEINGPLEVVVGSNGIEYSTPPDDQVSYIWSVTGQRSFLATSNTLTVDWGEIGEQEIGIIKTDLISGIRTFNSIQVNVLTLDPFTILQTNASCINTDNGSLQINSRTSLVSYMATLTGVGGETVNEFTDQSVFENLSAGSYDLCILEIGTDKTYCYQFIISEPAPFEVSSKMGSVSSKEVNLRFNGGKAPYTVLLNGRQIAETSQLTFKFKAESGDILEVLASGNCTFSHKEILNFKGEVSVSPNPVQDSFIAVLGGEFPEETQNISVRIFTSTGQQALHFTENISNHSIHCDVSTLSPGIYIVNVGDDERTSFKIVKK